MSMTSTLAEGELPEVARKTKYVFRAMMNEALSNYVKRVLAWINSNPKIPEATGNLKRSAAEIVSKSRLTGDRFEAYFGFAAPYAQYVEEGRPPGKLPPISAIRAWCITIGIPKEAANAIAWKIFHKGIPPKHFWVAAKTYAIQILREEIQRAVLKYKLIAEVRIS